MHPWFGRIPAIIKYEGAIKCSFDNASTASSNVFNCSIALKKVHFKSFIAPYRNNLLKLNRAILKNKVTVNEMGMNHKSIDQSLLALKWNCVIAHDTKERKQN